MGYDFNQIRKPNAKLIKGTIDKLGTTFAIEMGGDGFSSVTNVVAPMPTDIKEYLEGNTEIEIYACASNIDKLCEYALASFPNIEDLYLFKTSEIVVLEDDLSYLLDLNKIYVPSDLLSAYISAYPTLSSKFDTIVEDYTLTIPFVGDTTLTREYVDSVIAMLSNAEKNVITKVVIPTDFSSSSANAIAWTYDFSELPNLDNNIWYGTTQVDFSVWTIYGSGTLTSEIVESSIASIPNDKLSVINKVIVPNTFTNAEVYCLEPINNLPNIDTLDYSCPGIVGVEWRQYSWIEGCIVLYRTNTYNKLKYIIARNFDNQYGYNGICSQNDSIEEITITKDTNKSFSSAFERCSKLKKVIIDCNISGSWNPNASAAGQTINWIFHNCSLLEKIYMIKLQQVPTLTNTWIFGNISNDYKVYIDSNLLISFMTSSNWSNFSQHYVGVFTYDGTLPTFTGYTPTFYEDEDCTTPIATTDFVSGNRYYVKLTAI